MKKLLFVLFVLLQFGYLVNAQNDRTFYDVCESKAQDWVDFQRSTLTVKTLTSDFISFVSNSSAYSAKKVTNFNILKGIVKEGEEYPHPFYAYKVDDNSFFIISFEGVFDGEVGYAYYHSDKSREDETDENRSCGIDELKRFVSLIKSYQDTDLVVERAKAEEEQKAKQKVIDDETKAVFTDFMKNYKSKRIDLALEKAIRQQWNGENDGIVNPLLRIYFMSPTYDLRRNEFGIVVRKTVSAYIVYKWKKTEKCWMQWRNYGYESLGGGAFNDEIGYWIPGASVVANLPGNRELTAGKDSEVDCAAFK